MTTDLRTKLIQKGWVTEFNANTLTRLIEEHYAAEADEPAVQQGREPVAVTGRPSDAELLQMMPEQFRADLATVSRMAAHGAGTGVTPGVFRVSLNTGALDYARAVLARWGSRQPAPPADGELLKLAQQYSVVYLRSDGSACNPFQDGYDMRGNLLAFARAVWALAGNPEPAPPADGEVADVVRWLRSRAGIPVSPDFPAVAAYLTRAAELLQRQALVPVPVSERLPEPGDCITNPRTGQGQWCWAWTEYDAMPCSGRVPYSGRWRMMRREWLAEATHWLPANALPLPGVGEQLSTSSVRLTAEP